MGWYSYIAGYTYTSYGEEASLYSFLQNYFREASTYIVIPMLSKKIRSASLIAYGLFQLSLLFVVLMFIGF